MTAYYSEIDPFCCDWLSNLMDAGLITPGKIDDRSIEDVRPEDFAGYDRQHFFAGIGGWDYALNLAGWGDRPVMSGSCPCQPFSPAGKGIGLADERHLWPCWEWLIRQSKPLTIFGEQVEAAIRYGWLDLVFGTLESEGYKTGACVLGAHSVGAPHKRQRLYWLGHRDDLGQLQGEVGNEPQRRAGELALGEPSSAGIMADAAGSRREGGAGIPRVSGSDTGSKTGGLDYPNSQPAIDEVCAGRELHGSSGPNFWHDCCWIECGDGKRRPIESVTSEIFDGFPAGMGLVRDGDHAYISPLIEETENLTQRLKGYGNSLVPQLAAEFIKSFMIADEEAKRWLAWRRKHLK